MDWEAIGAIGELTAAIAVVISILYLAIQISSNTNALKAQAGFDATHSWAEFNAELGGRSDEELSLTIRSLTSGADEFSEIEYFRLAVIMRSLFQRLEGQYFLYKYGYLEDDLWLNRSAWCAGVIQTPFYARWWETEKAQRTYSAVFIQALENTRGTESVRNALLGGTEDN